MWPATSVLGSLRGHRHSKAKAMERVRARLEKLQRRVAKGRIKAAEKIGAAAARILARNHGHRYAGDCRLLLIFRGPL